MAELINRTKLRIEYITDDIDIMHLFSRIGYKLSTHTQYMLYSPVIINTPFKVESITLHDAGIVSNLNPNTPHNVKIICELSFVDKLPGDFGYDKLAFKSQINNMLFFDWYTLFLKMEDKYSNSDSSYIIRYNLNQYNFDKCNTNNTNNIKISKVYTHHDRNMCSLIFNKTQTIAHQSNVQIINKNMVNPIIKNYIYDSYNFINNLTVGDLVKIKHHNGFIHSKDYKFNDTHLNTPLKVRYIDTYYNLILLEGLDTGFDGNELELVNNKNPSKDHWNSDLDDLDDYIKVRSSHLQSLSNDVKNGIYNPLRYLDPYSAIGDEKLFLSTGISSIPTSADTVIDGKHINKSKGNNMKNSWNELLDANKDAATYAITLQAGKTTIKVASEQMKKYLPFPINRYSDHPLMGLFVANLINTTIKYKFEESDLANTLGNACMDAAVLKILDTFNIEEFVTGMIDKITIPKRLADMADDDDE